MPLEIARESFTSDLLSSFLSRGYWQKSPFSIKNRPFCIDSVIVTPLTVLLDHLAIHRTAAVFLFSYFGPNVGGNSILRKPGARVSGTRVQWYGRSAEGSRMRRSLSISGGLLLGMWHTIGVYMLYRPPRSLSLFFFFFFNFSVGL